MPFAEGRCSRRCSVIIWIAVSAVPRDGEGYKADKVFEFIKAAEGMVKSVVDGWRAYACQSQSTVHVQLDSPDMTVWQTDLCLHL